MPSDEEVSESMQYDRSVLLDRMWDRIEATRTESETALFYDLLVFGELVAKLLVLGLASAVEPSTERHDYRLSHQLVRADGIGEWASVLDDLLTGPASSHLNPEAISDSRELTKRFSSAETSWQYEAVMALQRVCLSIEPSRPTYSSKVAFKTWLNDFAWLRNRTRGHGAIRPTTCQQVAPDLEQSLRLIANNVSLFRRGWAYLRQNLSGKYRVTPLSGDVAPFEPLKSSRDLAMSDGVYIAFGDELRAVSHIDTDADLTDIFVANGAFKKRDGVFSFELLSYCTDTTRIGNGELWSRPPSELPPSETRSRPSMDLIGGSFSNLPSPVRDYVSRPDLEQELLELLRNDRHPVVTLVGRGGIGKTSLALSVLYEIAEAGDFFSICWFSARDIDLLTSGAKLVRPDVLTIEDIATDFADGMAPGWRRESDFVPLDYLARSLSGGAFSGDRLLFVFDNFETVRSPGELYAFLDSSIRLPNKVLITSRFRDFRGDYPVPIGGMSRSQFDALVDTTASRLGILGMLTGGYRDSLFDEADGHPYVGKILLGEVARTRKAGSIERIMAAQDDTLNALFERTYNSIPTAAQRVFLTLANWRSVVPRLALEAALLRPANERMNVSQALETLEQSSLVEVIETGEVDGEFVRVPLAAYVFGQKKLRVSPSKAAIEADTEIIRMFGAAHRTEVGRGVLPRARRMLSAVAQRKADGHDVADELDVMQYVARKFPPARLLLADFYEEEGQRQRAVEEVSSYLESVPVDRAAWLRLADLYLTEKDGPGEVFARFEAARLPDATLLDISNAASTLNRHNFHRSAGLGVDESRSMAEELVELLVAREPECNATDCSRLAWLLLHIGREADARRIVSLGLAMDSTNKHCVGLAARLGLETI